MMPPAAARLDRWLAGPGRREHGRRRRPDGKGLAEVRDALDDDLDTPAALAADRRRRRAR